MPGEIADDISAYFYRITGKNILPYQKRYASHPFEPSLIGVPTGLGKTLTVMVPWLHAVSHASREAPTRLIFVLPRQNLTEQTSRTASELVRTAGLADQVRVLELMGGSRDNDDRTLGPDEPAIIVSTQDLYLSRALNRGYARRPPRWPMDFALFNNDCLIVFDEIQLMSDGLATSTQLAAFRERFGAFGRVPCVWMSATLNPVWLDTIDFAAMRGGLRGIRIEDDDLEYEIVRRRLHAPKDIAPAPEVCRTPQGCAEFALEQHKPGERTLIIANTVPRAREIFAGLRHHPGAMLLHSRFRPGDRREKVEQLETIPIEGQIIVSTQVLEAGIDISAHRLITDAAPWSSLVQRFGRVNRYGDHEGRIWWVDRPIYSKVKPDQAEKLFAPYAPREVERAVAKLAALSTASPADLPPEDGPAPWQFVLRKADLLDLFDTSPDISGNHVDVSRFIRSGEEKDCYIAWRDWEDKPGEQCEIEDEELCPAPAGDLRDFSRKHNLYSWNFGEKAWEPLDSGRLSPGMILMAHATEGGYTREQGWAPESKQPVPACPPLAADEEGDGSDPLTWRSYRQTLPIIPMRFTERQPE